MEDKPLFRVGAAGLDPRDSRLIEIVFKHSQYNKYEYQLVATLEAGAVDILIVNSVEPEGLQALAQIRTSGRSVPVIAAVPRGAPSSARHAISIDRLTLQLLPILNRVVELELLSPETRPMGVGNTAAPSAGFASPAPAFTAPAPWAAPAAGRPEAPASTTAAPGAAANEPRATVPPAAGATTAGLAPGATPATPTGAARPSAATPALPETRAAEPTPASGVPASPVAASPLHASGPEAARPDTPLARPEFPAARPAEPAARAPTPPAQPSNLVNFPLNAVEPPISQRLRVLVVDDSPTVRRQLTVAFDRMGVACDTVESAAQALERLGESHFDLALVDVVMPDMDGYKLTREIKRNRQWRQLPVIILTSRSSPFDLARGALAGCDTYLTKPVPFRALEAAVIKQLRRSLAIDDLSGLIRTSAAPNQPAAPAPAPSGVMSRLFRR